MHQNRGIVRHKPLCRFRRLSMRLEGQNGSQSESAALESASMTEMEADNAAETLRVAVQFVEAGRALPAYMLDDLSDIADKLDRMASRPLAPVLHLVHRPRTKKSDC